jgi:hypothetical protein
MDTKGKLKRQAAYTAYSTAKYKRDYFDERTGGYLVIENQRIAQGKLNKQEREKFEKERGMCIVLAKNGYAVEYLKEAQGSYDILLNGIPADLKKTASHNNILGYAKTAVCSQGARIVVFELKKETAHIKESLKKLKKRGITVKYYFSSSPAKVMDL